MLVLEWKIDMTFALEYNPIYVGYRINVGYIIWSYNIINTFMSYIVYT